MTFNELVTYSQRIRAASARNDKITIIEEFLARLSTKEAAVGVNYIAGRTRQGKLNIVWKDLSTLMNLPDAGPSQVLSLLDIDEALTNARRARGRQKRVALASVFQRLKKQEREFLVMLVHGEVQQGAGEGLVKMAIARFFRLSDTDIEHAYMRMPDIGEMHVRLMKKGRAGIREISVQLFTPVKPMLARIADSVDGIFTEYDRFALEYKLDGVRVQVHKQHDTVKIFSRHLKDITVHFPEVVEAAQGIKVEECILDGEAIGVDSQGRPLPFQILAKRTTRKKDINAMRKKIRVVPRFFDVLYRNGDDITGLPYEERWRALTNIVKNANELTPRVVSVNKASGKKFYARALEKGSEGIMVKLLDAPYKAGKRGKVWFKIKQSHTIDCVILAAEWGSGRRTGWLSNLHLGVLDETRTKYLMVGKTFKGMTDTMLTWFTNYLQQIKVHEDTWTVYVMPEVVVEIAFNDVQQSPKYESGVALRFARVKTIREDKKPQEINTIVDLYMLSNRRTQREL